MPQEPTSIRPRELTWSVLLAKWVTFARSAVALPASGAEGLFKQSVPDIIGLQAVWFALGELDGLPNDQKSLGIDRAAVLIQTHGTNLRHRWAGETMPQGLVELIRDAESRLQAVRAG